MIEFLQKCYNNILRLENELSSIEKDLTKIKPGQNKWSPNELLGHLVDSALNNHCRFILMQTEDNLVFDGYDENKWVELQKYNDRDWSDILDTWVTLNINIIETLEAVNPQLWNKEFKNHSLDKTAWNSLPKSQSATMAYLVKDYFGHINHHLKQLYFLAKLEFTVAGLD